MSSLSAMPPGLRPAASALLLEPARIDALLELLGDRSVRGLLGLLVEECRERPHRLECCHARGDLAALRAEARSLSRAAATIGAAALGDAASPLASLSDVAVAEPLIDALDAAARATLNVVQQWLLLRGAPLPRA